MTQGNTFYFSWEVELMEWLQQHVGPAGSIFAKIFTLFGEELVMIALLGFLYWCWDKEAAKKLGTVIVTGVVLNPMLKNILLRRRPYFDHEKIRCLKPVDSGADIYDITAQGYSFPSGHSCYSAILYGSSPLLFRRKWAVVLAAALPFFVGVSRFVLGVHYPTDVLAGWILGYSLAFLIIRLEGRVKRRGRLHLILFLLGCGGIFYCRTADYFTGLGVMAGFFLAVSFEERFVRFANTRKPWRWILRMAAGFSLYFGLNLLMKLPFSEHFLESGSLLSLLVRFLRYTVICFLVLGVYPMFFRKRGLFLDR